MCIYGLVPVPVVVPVVVVVVVAWFFLQLLWAVDWAIVRRRHRPLKLLLNTYTHSNHYYVRKGGKRDTTFHGIEKGRLCLWYDRKRQQ